MDIHGVDGELQHEKLHWDLLQLQKVRLYKWLVEQRHLDLKLEIIELRQLIFLHQLMKMLQVKLQHLVVVMDDE